MAKKHAVHLNKEESALKCDNPKCDYRDNTVDPEKLSDHINRLCPKCGENLLTYDDFINAQTALKMIEVFNTLPDKTIEKLAKTAPQNATVGPFKIETHKGIFIDGKNLKSNPTT